MKTWRKQKEIMENQQKSNNTNHISVNTSNKLHELRLYNFLEGVFR